MISHKHIKEALLIRRVEESFLELFSKGKLNGTVHTSVGQEFSAIAFAGQLKKQDFVFSNHRCHGHYISFTKDYSGLLGELMGKETGICGGVGSSQHLQNGNFYSNGIQGGIVPLAAGMALANKILKNDNIGVVYIGDGTLGEGVLYETLNIISLWNLPLIVVCENNSYAQSTFHTDNRSGSILKRAEAFSIQTFEDDTWDVENLILNAKESIEYVRKNKRPVFHLVNTYRLNAHSKGDDDRDKNEIKHYQERDFLNRFSVDDPVIFQKYLEEINTKIDLSVTTINESKELSLNEYIGNEDYKLHEKKWKPTPELKERQVNLLNQFFDDTLNQDEKALFIGEDVKSPYGGAFKVAKDLSHKYPNQVFTTPISEAAITGIGNGLALSGFKPFIEIMFGDFIILALDQIINHASKAHHMYNRKVNCPVVIRTPMGGRRGYGPTHSQTLDRFLIGIENVKTVAINTLINPKIIYNQVYKESNPVIVIENKSDYGKFIGKQRLDNYAFMVNNDDYPVVRISPMNSVPNITLVTYGGMAEEVINSVEDLFYEHDYKAEVLVISKINPIDYTDIIDSVQITKKIVVIEEGNSTGGIGSEIISNVHNLVSFHVHSLKIGALHVPIPSVKSLENQVLPNKNTIINAIKNL